MTAFNWRSTWNGQAALADDLRLDALRARKRGNEVSAVKLEQEADEIARHIGYNG